MNRQDEIREKGFDMTRITDYGKIKVGVKTLDDAILNLGSLKAANKNYGDKKIILKALADKDISTLLKALYGQIKPDIYLYRVTL